MVGLRYVSIYFSIPNDFDDFFGNVLSFYISCHFKDVFYPKAKYSGKMPRVHHNKLNRESQKKLKNRISQIGIFKVRTMNKRCPNAFSLLFSSYMKNI